MHIKPVYIKVALRSDAVTDEEIADYLAGKVAEAYPSGEVEWRESSTHLFGRSADIVVRQEPQAVGIRNVFGYDLFCYDLACCGVQTWRKNDGRLEITVQVGNLDCSTIIDQILLWVFIKKSSKLVDEVVEWLTPYLQEKQNEFDARTAAVPPPDAPPEQMAPKEARKCANCGAQIPPDASACLYCGSEAPSGMPPSVEA